MPFNGKAVLVAPSGHVLPTNRMFRIDTNEVLDLCPESFAPFG